MSDEEEKDEYDVWEASNADPNATLGKKLRAYGDVLWADWEDFNCKDVNKTLCEYAKLADEMTAKLAEARRELGRANETADKYIATVRYYQSALYQPGIRPMAIHKGVDAIEIKPERVMDIVRGRDIYRALLGRHNPEAIKKPLDELIREEKEAEDEGEIP